MKTVYMLAAVLCSGGLCSCATIIEGDHQKISVTTPPVQGAECTLTNPAGVFSVTSPGEVLVHRNGHDINVVCKRDGYLDANQVVQSHFNGVTIVNILAGGAIGAGMDAATGANFSYPHDIVVPMTAVAIQLPSPAPEPVAQPSLAPSAEKAPSVTAPAAKPQDTKVPSPTS